MKHIARQLFWFVAVGATSAAVHWLVVVFLVSNLAIPPLVANIGGWLVAFIVSFTGHHHLTFRHHDTQAFSAMRRFFMLSACGFAINETAYAALLRYTQINYEWLLAGILIGVAFLTFIVSKLWAFAPKRLPS